jgi:hypothetical protein
MRRRNWGHFFTWKKYPSCTQNRALPTHHRTPDALPCPLRRSSSSSSTRWDLDTESVDPPTPPTQLEVSQVECPMHSHDVMTSEVVVSKINPANHRVENILLLIRIMHFPEWILGPLEKVSLPAVTELTSELMTVR